MGTFSSSKVFYVNPSLIPQVADAAIVQLQMEGYEVTRHDILGGGAEFSISKGGIFRFVMGLKMALKISLTPGTNCFTAEASAGILGHRAVPTALTVAAFAIPSAFAVMTVSQIWGLIKQSKLDNHVLAVIETAVQQLASRITVIPGSSAAATPPVKGFFCHRCSSPTGGGKFCPQCGADTSSQVAAVSGSNNTTPSFCPNCGSLASSGKFCQQCGTKL